MSDGGQRVVLEAQFKSSGLDKLGRDFAMVSERMKRMASAMRSWGQGGQVPQNQFAIGGEMAASHDKLLRLRKMQVEKIRDLDMTQDANKRKLFQGQLDRINRLGQAEQNTLDRLGRGSVEAGSKLTNATNLRRGLRLGLGALGLPLSLGAAGRETGEALEQEKMVSGMAVRLRETITPIKDFTEYTIDLRKGIVAAGAEFAFSGRESLALADNLSQMAGGLVNMRAVFESARALGVAPQATGQALAMNRRLGGRGMQSPAADEKFAISLAGAIGSSGMMPRSGEFIQAITQAMQTYSTRLPSVSPDTLMQLFSALSAEGTAGRPGVGRLAPTLRGQGGAQVVQGMTAMMDDMSEAMIAIQSEIVKRDPGAFAKTARTLGLDVGAGSSGGDRYAMVTALKQAGVADPDGLRLAGRTIKEVTTGLDKGTRIAVESQLLRLSPQIVAQLEAGGFIQRLTDEKIGFKDFTNAVNRFSESGMNVPGQQFSRLGREFGAEVTSFFEQGISPMGPYAGAAGEMISEGRGRTASEKAMADQRRIFTGTAGMFGIASLAAMTPWLAASAAAGPLGMAAVGTYALGAAMDPRQRAETGNYFGGSDGFNKLEIVVKIDNLTTSARFSQLAGYLADKLGYEIAKHAATVTRSKPVQGEPSPNSDLWGR